MLLDCVVSTLVGLKKVVEVDCTSDSTVVVKSGSCIGRICAVQEVVNRSVVEIQYWFHFGGRSGCVCS